MNRDIDWNFFILSFFQIVNFIFPFFLGWIIPGVIGGIMGMFLGIYDGTEVVFGPLALIGVIFYLIKRRKKAKDTK